MYPTPERSECWPSERSVLRRSRGGAPVRLSSLILAFLEHPKSLSLDVVFVIIALLKIWYRPTLQNQEVQIYFTLMYVAIKGQNTFFSRGLLLNKRKAPIIEDPIYGDYFWVHNFFSFLIIF